MVCLGFTCVCSLLSEVPVKQTVAIAAVFPLRMLIASFVDLGVVRQRQGSQIVLEASGVVTQPLSMIVPQRDKPGETGFEALLMDYRPTPSCASRMASTRAALRA